MNSEIKAWIFQQAHLSKTAVLEPILENRSCTYFKVQDQSSYLLKWDTKSSLDLAEWEFHSSRLLYSFFKPKVLLPVLYGAKDFSSFILFEQEHIQKKEPSSDLIAQAFGSLHRTKVPWTFGFNYPSGGREKGIFNTFFDDWFEFFFKRRLNIVLRKENNPIFTQFFAQNYTLIIEKSPSIRASLLHGNPHLFVLNDQKECVALNPYSIYGHDQFEVEILLYRGVLQDSDLKIYRDKHPAFNRSELLYHLYHFYFSLKEFKNRVLVFKHFDELRDLILS